MKAEESLSREKPLISVIVPAHNVECFLECAAGNIFFMDSDDYIALETLWILPDYVHQRRLYQ